MRVLMMVLALATVATATPAPLLEPVSGTGLGFAGTTFGGTWTDLNGDGLPDLVLSRHSAAGPDFFRNLGDLRFEPLLPGGPLPGGVLDLHGVGVGDYDGDGLADLLLSVGADRGRGRGEKQLWRNLGGLCFENVAPPGGLIADGPGRGRGALWLPLSKGRRPALMLLNFASPTRLFLPAGEGWQDASDTIAPPPDDGWATAAAADFDGDGHCDLFAACSAWTVFQGDGSGLTRLGGECGVRDLGPPLATALAGDLDNDGDPDLVLALRERGAHILRNDSEPGRIRFAPAWEHPSGLSCRNNVSATLGDLDGDGDLDLAIAGRAHLTLALGDGALGFRSLPPAETGAVPSRSGTCSVDAVDLDDDGRLELLVFNGERHPNPVPDAGQVYRVPAAGPGWTLALESRTETVHGLGARVVLESPAGPRTRQIRSIGNPWSSTVPPVHFGVGAEPGPWRVRVIWPSGREQIVKIPSAGRGWLLREGADDVVARALNDPARD